ncbi:MAG: alpha/beta hydrolase [bacterium]|nr:alpha/beta hydrolase [bacterium]
MNKTWFETLTKNEAARGVKPDNQSFYLSQASPACSVVLVVHGFSANPNDGKTVANAIFETGHCDVVGICLPGHGSAPQDMETVTYRDWLNHVDSVYNTLREHYQQVVIYSVSMGALLSLTISSKTPPAGLVCMGTMLVAVDWRLKYGGYIGGFISFVLRRILNKPFIKQNVLPGREGIVYNEVPVESTVELHKLMRLTKTRLNKVECPTLIIHSTTDKIADAKGAQYLYDHLGTRNKAIIWGTGDHTFLTEMTDENADTIAKIVTFCTSPIGYFSNAAKPNNPRD